MDEKYINALWQIYRSIRQRYGDAEIYVRGSLLHSPNPRDIDVVVVFDRIPDDVETVKATYWDGGRRYTRVAGRRLPLNFEGLGVEVVYSFQTEYGMRKYNGVPIEITVIRRGERGKPWREIKGVCPNKLEIGRSIIGEVIGKP